MANAYENYATASTLAVASHNAWRRLRHTKGHDRNTGTWTALKADANPQVKAALTKATKAGMLREDAKAQYGQARNAARCAA